jgi:hypothetical protein
MPSLPPRNNSAMHAAKSAQLEQEWNKPHGLSHADFAQAKAGRAIIAHLEAGIVERIAG